MSDISKIVLPNGEAYGIKDTSVINPNLLINGSLLFNQRGKSEYSGETGPDKWLIGTSAKLTYIDGAPVLNTNTSPAAAAILLRQDIKGFNGRAIAGHTVTLSIDAVPSSENFILRLYAYTADGSITRRNRAVELRSDTTPWEITTDIPTNAPFLRIAVSAAEGAAAGETLTFGKGIKLELGGRATGMCSAQYNVELARCQRYYQVHTTGDIDPVDLRPTMATITDIVQREDGNYGYIATD